MIAMARAHTNCVIQPDASARNGQKLPAGMLEGHPIRDCPASALARVNVILPVYEAMQLRRGEPFQLWLSGMFRLITALDELCRCKADNAEILLTYSA